MIRIDKSLIKKLKENKIIGEWGFSEKKYWEYGFIYNLKFLNGHLRKLIHFFGRI